MKRYQNGVAGDFFHQKRVPAHPDYVGEQFVRFPSGHSTVFAVIDNAAALAWVINLGCIELHTWHSRVDDIERPDYMLIDLDPTTDGQWEDVLTIALVVRQVLDELELPSYPKTSGSTGLHILTQVVDLVPNYMFNGYGASTDLIAKDRTLIRDLVISMIEANRTIYRDKD